MLHGIMPELLANFAIQLSCSTFEKNSCVII